MIDLVSQYIAMLRSKGAPELEYFWDEMARIDVINYQTLERTDAFTYGEELSNTMLHTQPGHFLNYAYLWESYDAAEIDGLLALLTTDKCLAILSSPAAEEDGSAAPGDDAQEGKEGKEGVVVAEGEEGEKDGGDGGGKVVLGHALDQTEPWFGINYTTMPIPTVAGDGSSTVSCFHLPAPNTMIPDDLSIKASDKADNADKADKEDAAPTESEEGEDGDGVGDEDEVLSAFQGSPLCVAYVKRGGVPTILEESPKLRMWHKQDDLFAIPKAYAYFRIRVKEAFASPAAIVRTSLYLELVRDSLQERAYQASIAGLDYDLELGDDAVIIGVRGYSSKLVRLAELVANVLGGDLDPKPARFDVARERVERRIKNAWVKPERHARDLRVSMLMRSPLPCDELAVLGSITNDEIMSYGTCLFEQPHAHMEAMVHGNITAEDTKSLVTLVARVLRLSPAAGDAASEGKAAEGNAADGKAPAASGGVLGAAAAVGGGDAGGDAGEDAGGPRCRVFQRDTDLLITSAVANAKEANNVCEVYWQLGAGTVERCGMADLMEKVMEEPLFDVLRTKQALGYTVRCGTRLTRGWSGFCVTVKGAAVTALDAEARIEGTIGRWR